MESFVLPFVTHKVTQLNMAILVIYKIKYLAMSALKIFATGRMTDIKQLEEKKTKLVTVHILVLIGKNWTTPWPCIKTFYV